MRDWIPDHRLHNAPVREMKDRPMTRDEKLEAMSRAWCIFGGWNPDELVPKFGGGRTEPMWVAYRNAMDVVLTAAETGDIPSREQIAAGTPYIEVMGS